MKVLLVVLLPIISTLSSPNGSRITGGESALPGEFPFVAAIYVAIPKAYFFCTGALINTEWILTSASCITGGAQFTVILGSHRLDELEQDVISLTAKDFVSHPDFDAATLENDIALIQLPVAVEYTTRIRPVRLPNSTIEAFEAGVTMGWGQTGDNGEMSTILRYVTLWALPESDCQNIYDAPLGGTVVCFLGNNNDGTCYGDGGSPIIRHNTNGETVITGVSSFISTQGCDAVYPSGFTKVYEYNDWIKETAGL